MIAHLVEWDWEKSEREFLKALAINPNDKPARLYIERSRYFMEHPPGDDWNGVWVMESK